MIFLRKHGHFPRLLSFSVAFWSKKSGPTAALPTKKVPGGASFKKANGVGSVHLKCEARDQWISGSSFFFGEDEILNNGVPLPPILDTMLGNDSCGDYSLDRSENWEIADHD